MNLSLDGFMSGANAELDWHFNAWNEEMGEKLLELLEKADTILLGRHTYEVMATYWPMKPLEQNFPRQDLAIADKMNRYTKIVFSKSDIALSWNNSKFARKNAEVEIIQLKQQKGKDIILIGSGRLVTSIMELNLIDEYQLWIHPVILGKGNPLFKGCGRHTNLQLRESVVFELGVIALNYEVIH